MLTIENRAGIDVLVMNKGAQPATEGEVELFAEVVRLRAEVDSLKSEDARLRTTWQKESDELVQILGKALRYPRFVDDQSVFPGATEPDGVCVPCHTAMSIADEAAEKIEALRAEVEQWRKASAKLIEHDRNLCDRIDPLYDERDSLKAEVEALRADAATDRKLVQAAEKFIQPVLQELQFERGHGSLAVHNLRLVLIEAMKANAKHAEIDAARAAQGDKP